MSKRVAYFSCSGTTRRTAEQLAERVGGRICLKSGPVSHIRPLTCAGGTHGADA